MSAFAEPGCVEVLADAFASLSELEFRLGDWRAAHASATQAVQLATANGAADAGRALANLSLVEAGLGHEQACRRHGEQAIRSAPRLRGSGQPAAHAALGLLELGLGRFEAAVAWLEPLGGEPNGECGTWLGDLVEALIRSAHVKRARAVLAATRAGAGTTPLDTRRALERCRGLLATDDEFEAHFAHALDYSLGVDEPFERARTELALGERLRRTGDRAAAQVRLRCALDQFERLGAALWIESTERELIAV